MITEPHTPLSVPFQLLWELDHSLRVYASPEDVPDAKILQLALAGYLDAAYDHGHADVPKALLDRVDAAVRSTAARLAVEDAETAAGLRARADWLTALRIADTTWPGRQQGPTRTP